MQASTFVMFPDVHSACSAASVLRDQTAVDAVEMFDTASLRWACLQPAAHQHFPATNCPSRGLSAADTHQRAGTEMKAIQLDRKRGSFHAALNECLLCQCDRVSGDCNADAGHCHDSCYLATLRLLHA